MRRIVMELTEEQQDILQPIMKKIDAMAATGKKGMVLAQVWDKHIEVGILMPTEAEKFTRLALGVEFDI